MLQDKEVPTRRAKKARKEVMTQDCYKKTDTLGLFCSLTAITLILTGVLVIAAAVFIMRPANTSRQEAQNIAIDHVGGGTANRASRDFEGFQRAWYVEVFHNGLVYEIYVSMRTGEVISMEVDRWD